MAFVFHLLLFGLAGEGFYEVQVEGGVDAPALVLQPQLLPVLLDYVLH